jgi:UDP-N-acetylmuramate dehydrogenase
VTVIGLGSNLIVRDGGVPGVVIRLGGKGFGTVAAEEGHRIRAGTAVPDVKVARAAADAAIDGLAFYPRHSGLDRRGVAHERGRARWRDHGRADRGAGVDRAGEFTSSAMPRWASPTATPAPRRT